MERIKNMLTQAAWVAAVILGGLVFWGVFWALLWLGYILGFTM